MFHAAVRPIFPLNRDLSPALGRERCGQRRADLDGWGAESERGAGRSAAGTRERGPGWRADEAALAHMAPGDGQVAAADVRRVEAERAPPLNVDRLAALTKI